MSGMITMTKAEMAKRAKEAKRMHKLQQRMLSQAVEQAKKKQDDWVMVEPASAIDMIKDAIKRKGGKRRNTKRKPKKRHRRKTRKRRKRRVKKRRRTKRR